MKFRIHFDRADGTEDSFDVEGVTLEEIRKKAGVELFHRTKNVDANAWSEELAP